MGNFEYLSIFATKELFFVRVSDTVLIRMNLSNIWNLGIGYGKAWDTVSEKLYGW